MTVDDNAILQAIEARHNESLQQHTENRKDIRAQGDRMEAMVTAQERTATALEATDSKLERVYFIVEGDGNGNPGLSRKFDEMRRDVKRLVDVQDTVIEYAKRGAKILIRYVIPAFLLWLASWFSIPGLRHFVHQFTVDVAPPVIVSQQPSQNATK